VGRLPSQYRSRRGILQASAQRRGPGHEKDAGRAIECQPEFLREQRHALCRPECSIAIADELITDRAQLEQSAACYLAQVDTADRSGRKRSS
jgi:hypothetical protein